MASGVLGPRSAPRLHAFPLSGRRDTSARGGFCSATGARVTSNLDVLGGINDGAAYKAPCMAATTADLTGAMIGLLVIDGYQTVLGDRVLVWQNTTQSTNGIYTVNSGAWTIASDFSNSSAVVQGTQVYVNEGSSYGGKIFRVTTTGPITIGATNITFAHN